MSRQRDDYENSRWRKFRSWIDGEVDPLASGIMIQPPKAPIEKRIEKPKTENPVTLQSESIRTKTENGTRRQRKRKTRRDGESAGFADFIR